ncbi:MULTISPECIES: xanthine dehydrogenase family protein molybdopterin-binding subunit [unclassified Paenibacillus]|uniref:xanthine dehydrogenase family protein molybdopterin-binding subunit n=1 Tax=unclassified Paenibacillus TaxID=185978 RepID=UPI001AE2AEA1|nr:MULTISPECIES: xanthine dehydrogenase family protein molybdopterin-binding subunit [unclassified Paenibacillus]MBP1154470.1 carbon-monoxide dehydrogenase large subunit [Paenibacillus sp. PvP091]MBP1170146.1 carbon-monoxide dehydrogenase large subunit [Paenibacillus sp. PvR098]MBP2441174.1 carbon-monoxide dehydrogenase large subunit [Paenibacillus sp. PvP052]
MRYLGKALPRKEDLRLITGNGRYLADIESKNALHMAVLRSPHAHARIVKIDLTKAKQFPEVIAAVSFEQLGAMGKKLPMLVPHPALRSETPYPLAKDKVNYVGEPVAVVVATSRYIAEDALELIDIEYDALPVVGNPEDALKADAPLLHMEVGSNTAAMIIEKTGDAQSAFANADVVIRSKFRIGRCSVQPMESRGVLAIPDTLGNLTIWDSTQSVHTIRRLIVGFLGLEEQQVRLIAPDVGGGFGAKNRLYPEEILVPWLALQLGRPVKWVGDRMEDLMASYQERDQWHEAEMALTKDGKILAVRDHFLADNGAYTPFGIVVPYTTAITIPGPYKVPNFYAQMTCVYTNKTPVAPYRGAGRPQGVFVIERLLDLAAEQLGLDKAEIRLRNLIHTKEMPYDTGLFSRDGRKMIYHSGDYPQAFQQALDMIDYNEFQKLKEDYRKEGRYLGIGLANYIEMAGLGPFEGAKVKVDPVTGKVTVSTGAGSQGQGHETTLAQVCAERLGVSFDDVKVVGGDTGAIEYGVGTWASRVAVAGGNAVSGAALKVRDKALKLGGLVLQADPMDLDIVEGMIQVKNDPDRNVSLQKIAMISVDPSRSTQRHLPEGSHLPDDFQPGLEESFYYYPSALTFANGTHAAIVEVDPSTAAIKVHRYIVVDDCGKVLNPMIVKGQVIGGVAQGLGNAIYEEMIHDNNGQVLTATYMDYMIPTSMEVPDIQLGHMESPDPNNPEGVKGCGEGGVVPVPAVINSAIDDALSSFGIYTTETPVSPFKLWKLLKKTKGEEKTDGN